MDDASMPQGTAIAIGLFVLVGVAIPGALVWRDLRRERRWLASPVPPDATADFSGYLGEVSRRLGFAPEQNEEICAEIEAHLHDTADAMVLDGEDPATARRRAMTRLGSPADLATALRDARRDHRPALATVGGGAIDAGIGVVQGTFFATFLLVGIAGLVFAPFWLLGATGITASSDGWTGAIWRALMIPAVCVGLAYGSRRGVLAVARASRRSVAGVGRAWALLGAAIVAWLAIFVVEDDMGWLEAVARLGLPVAVAVGALGAGRPWLPASRTRLAMGAIGLLGGFVAVAVVTAPPQAPSGPEPFGLEVLPPRAPAGTVPSDDVQLGLSTWCREEGGVVRCEFLAGQPAPPLAPPWRDLRLEAWPATHEGSWSATGVDPAARRPTIVAPVDPHRLGLATSMEVGERRDGPGWWMVLTGVHADGERYRLTDGSGVVVPFEGTVADWVNAPG